MDRFDGPNDEQRQHDDQKNFQQRQEQQLLRGQVQKYCKSIQKYSEGGLRDPAVV